MAVTPPMAVVETEEFLNRSKAILTETERSLLVAHLGTNPEAGQLVPGTGGVRKIRWATPGQGKRGGARVIYLRVPSSSPSVSRRFGDLHGPGIALPRSEERPVGNEC